MPTTPLGAVVTHRSTGIFGRRTVDVCTLTATRAALLLPVAPWPKLIPAAFTDSEVVRGTSLYPTRHVLLRGAE